MQVSSVMEIKQKNRNRIYRLILERGRISKQEIAYALGLSLPTVTQNLVRLQEEGLIGEDGTFDSTGGRRARCLTCLSRARVAFGIDITQNHVTIAAADLKGEIVDYERVSVRRRRQEEYIGIIREGISGLMEKNHLDSGQVLGAGVALPAIIGEEGRTIQYMTLLDLPKDFYERLGEAISFPYRLCNDANGAGFGEMWKRKTSSTMLYLFLGATVGGAILNNGRLYEGVHQRAGEFGHMTLVPGGRPCYCGKRGCVDSYLASGVLTDYTDGRIEEFFRLLDAGDAECIRRWEAYKENLAIVINNLQCFYDCRIVLGGHVGGCIEPYLDDIRSLAAQRNTHSSQCDYVEASILKWEAPAMGAALLYIDEFVKKI